MFCLRPRLALCAELVRPGRALADIGTDHAYLPIWLLKSGKTPRALACDVNPGPLEAARRHARRYGVGEELRLLLSDGLREVPPEDAEDVVIAGMGGELILRIVAEAPWLRDGAKRLVLQPMSAADKLRLGLKELGFQVLEERAAVDGGKPYSGFSAAYQGEGVRTGPLYPWMGRLAPGGAHVEAYAAKVLSGLEKQRMGAAHQGRAEEAERLGEVIQKIKDAYGYPDGQK